MPACECLSEERPLVPPIVFEMPLTPRPLRCVQQVEVSLLLDYHSHVKIEVETGFLLVVMDIVVLVTHLVYGWLLHLMLLLQVLLTIKLTLQDLLPLLLET